MIRCLQSKEASPTARDLVLLCDGAVHMGLPETGYTQDPKCTLLLPCDMPKQALLQALLLLRTHPLPAVCSLLQVKDFKT